MYLYLLSTLPLPILQQDTNDSNLMWYVLIALIILLLLILFWLWWQEPDTDGPTTGEQTAVTADEVAADATAESSATFAAIEVTQAEPVAVKSGKPDDLTRIEGIGPKISGILHDAGIHSFAQLAETDVETLQKILQGKVRLFFPDTWPEQAALAARGDWEALKTLQDTFKAGRRQ